MCGACPSTQKKSIERGKDMLPNPTELLRIAGIATPLIGFYDVPDPGPFAPFASPQHCIFSAYGAWQKGESVLITKEAFNS